MSPRRLRRVHNNIISRAQRFSWIVMFIIVKLPQQPRMDRRPRRIWLSHQPHRMPRQRKSQRLGNLSKVPSRGIFVTPIRPLFSFYIIINATYFTFHTPCHVSLSLFAMTPKIIVILSPYFLFILWRLMIFIIIIILVSHWNNYQWFAQAFSH